MDQKKAAPATPKRSDGGQGITIGWMIFLSCAFLILGMLVGYYLASNIPK